jgi:hypothetical protein
MQTTHLSNSQLSDWIGCQKRYQLTRLQGAPQQPSVWLVGGTAVHAAIEAINQLDVKGTSND